MADKAIRLGVVAIIVREKEDGSFEIMTQTRVVRNPQYDPLNHLTQECMGELLNPGEHPLEALDRGVLEECNINLAKTPHRIVGNEDTLFHETGRGDKSWFLRPFGYIFSTGEPQLWHDPVFIVLVSEKDFEPDYANADGEAKNCTWWKPQELLSEMQANPLKFMTLHVPVLQYLCEQLITKGEQALM